MSNTALFTQATHTLTLIGQKNPTQEDLKQLHNGLLSDLIEAIMSGKIPDREKFRKFLELQTMDDSQETNPYLDPIIRIDRSIRPSYPDWKEEVLYPELEKVGPIEYGIPSVELWLHDSQKDGKRVNGYVIFDHLKKTNTLKSCLGLRNLEEIQKKHIALFRKHFKGKAVFGWAGIVLARNGYPFVPYLYGHDDRVVLHWRWAGHDWYDCDPALRFASSLKT